jgi:phosphoribosyl-ATP pyrophosphohydrolase/phosphoribosyl-AMP cyclohydrolase
MKSKNMDIDLQIFKSNTLIPAIIQDVHTKTVLMLGYMNQESYGKTIETGKVTFFSRSKQRLWTKGEESGNVLNLVSVALDCDEDTFLIQVVPAGPTCHKGTDTCWNQKNEFSKAHFLKRLEEIIENRLNDTENESSYVRSLIQKGLNKVAQKVGEEGVEVVIAALNESDEAFLNENADLLFHQLILLQAKGFRLKDVIEVLEKRQK